MPWIWLASASHEQRPNPEASFEAARDTPHEVLSLAFPLELGGKRGRRIDLANATLARTTADLAVQTLDVRRAVRLAYYELVAATAQVQITSELRGLAERTRNAARDRFESGAAPRLEALQAELALAQADNEEEAARGRRTAARTSLNTAIGRAPESPAEPIDPFDAGIVPADPAAIVAAGPDIAALDREIDEAVARERLATAMRTPDPTVSGGALFDAQPEFTYGWRFGVAVAVPIFTRHNAEVQVEAAHVAQLRAQREARVAILTGEALAAATRAEAARRQYLRYRDEIMPQLTTIEAMAEDSYRSGQTNLTAFLQARARRQGIAAPGHRGRACLSDRACRSRACARRTDPMTKVWRGLALASAFAGAACHGTPPDETEAETAVAVAVEPARTGPIREVIAATGIVTAAARRRAHRDCA